MVKEMRKITLTAMCLVIILFGINGLPIQASELSSHNNIDTALVLINGKTVEVPLIKNNVKTVNYYKDKSLQNTYRLQTAAEDAINDIQTILIPNFSAMSMEEHISNMNQLKTKQITPMTVGHGGFTDNGNYIYFSTTLNYTSSRSRASDGNYYTFVDLISYKIGREIYTQAPFSNFHNADAKALQVGLVDKPSSQTVELLVNQQQGFSTLAYGEFESVPASWIPVVQTGSTPPVGVTYRVKISLTSGASYFLEYAHTVM